MLILIFCLQNNKSIIIQLSYNYQNKSVMGWNSSSVIAAGLWVEHVLQLLQYEL